MAEFDRDYPAFHARWKSRLGLKDRHLAMGYMRHEKVKAEGGAELPNDPASAAIYIRVDDRGVDAYVDFVGLRTLVSEWQAALDASTDREPRAFTKDFIAQVVSLGTHDEPDGEMIVCAALWLLASKTPEALDMLSPETALLCRITYDDKARMRRLRLELISR